MAHVEDRWEKVVSGRKVRTDRYGKGERWRARYLDPNGKERSRTFARKADAERFLATVETDKLRGSYLDPSAGRITVDDFYRDWSSRQIWETNTRLAMDLALRSSELGPMQLANLRRSHVESWVKRMDSKGLAAGTIKTRVNNVRSILRAAMRDQLIAANPADHVTLPRDRRREASMVLPRPEEVAAIMESAEPAFRAFVATAAFAGLRLGEIAGLQIRDIDFLRRSLEVRRQVQRSGRDAIEVRAPKYGSERVVYLADELLEVIAAHITNFRPGDDKTRWLFEASGGNPPHQNTVGHQWRLSCQRAKVTHLTLHDLRHFYASGLIADGCDVVTVQRALGHAKATTTLNTYAHLWPTAEDRTRKAAGGLFRQAVEALQAARKGDTGRSLNAATVRS